MYEKFFEWPISDYSEAEVSNRIWDALLSHQEPIPSHILFTLLSRSVNLSHQPISQFGSRDGTKTGFSCADQKQDLTKGDFGCGKGLEVSLETIP